MLPAIDAASPVSFPALVACPSPHDVEHAVYLLYNDPNRVAAANAWLTQLQESPFAWQVGHHLLSSTRSESRFFAANLLLNKVKTCLRDLPEDQKASLKASLTLFLSNPERETPHVTAASLAMAHLILNDAVPSSFFASPAFANLKPNVICEILTAIPQELTNTSMSQDRRDKVQADLQQSMYGVVQMMGRFFGDVSDVRLCGKCLRCLQSWSTFGLSLTVLFRSEIWPKLLHIISNPGPLIEYVADMMDEVVVVAERPKSGDIDAAVIQLSTAVASLVPHLNAALAGNAFDEQFCISVSKLGACLGSEETIGIVCRSTEALGLVDLMIRCVGVPSYSASEYALEFFSNVQVINVTDRIEPLRRAVFETLIQTIATTTSRLAADFASFDASDVDEDEFNAHRRRVKDTILDVCTILGGDGLKVLTIQLQSLTLWNEIESVIFCMGAMAGELIAVGTDAQKIEITEWISGVMSQMILAGKLPPHPQLQCTCLKLFEAYSRLICRNTPLVEQCLAFAVSLLANHQTAGAASGAFKALCQASRDHLAKSLNLDAMIRGTTPHLGHLGAPHGINVTEGLSLVIGCCAVDRQRGCLAELCTPIIARINEKAAKLNGGGFVKASDVHQISVDISYLGSALRYLEPASTGGGNSPGSASSPHHQQLAMEQHPVMCVLQSSWSTIEGVVGKLAGDESVMEPVCMMFERGLKAGGTAIGPVLPAMVNLMMTSMRASEGKHGCVYQCTAVLMEVFGSDKSLVPHFASLVTEVVGHIVKLASNPDGIASNSDVIAAFYDFSFRTMIFCPDAMLQPHIFPSVAQLALAALALRDRDACRSVFVFLERVVALREDPRVGPWLMANGGEVTRSILFAVSDTAPMELVSRLSLSLLLLMAFVGETGRQWLMVALQQPNFPGGVGVKAEDKVRFANCLLRLIPNQRRIMALVADFAKLCRGMMDAEALLAYEQ